MWCRLRNFTESRFYKRVIFASPALILPCFGMVNVRKHDGYGSIPPRCHIFGGSDSHPKVPAMIWCENQRIPRGFDPWSTCHRDDGSHHGSACRHAWQHAWQQHAEQPSGGMREDRAEVRAPRSSRETWIVLEKFLVKLAEGFIGLIELGIFFLSMKEELHICRSSQPWKNAWQAGADITKVTNNWGSNGPTNRPFLQTFQVL